MLSSAARCFILPSAQVICGAARHIAFAQPHASPASGPPSAAATTGCRFAEARSNIVGNTYIYTPVYIYIEREGDIY